MADDMIKPTPPSAAFPSSVLTALREQAMLSIPWDHCDGEIRFAIALHALVEAATSGLDKITPAAARAALASYIDRLDRQAFARSQASIDLRST